ncbi:MAG TPA: histidinol dehydrogenase, partial [Vitreimonas sp.]|nr:histidinol dehydrogenase [Vitreimonas sp.]
MTVPTPTLSLRRLDLGSDADRPALDALVHRGAVPDPGVRDAVRALLDEIRVDPSRGVRAASARFGGGPADGRILLGRVELEAARDRLDPTARQALEQAIEHVTRFAEAQRPRTTTTTITDGIEIERRWEPLDSVGAYVPGGSAPYPSSLLMTVAPARVAGVGRVVVASPAGAEGRPDDIVLGAAGLLGVDTFVVA